LNPVNLLYELRRRRIVVTPIGAQLHYRAPIGALTYKLRAEIEAGRAGLIGVLRSEGTALPENVGAWPRAARERFEERAAIAEFDAGKSRDEAERQAEQEIRMLWANELERRWHDNGGDGRAD